MVKVGHALRYAGVAQWQSVRLPKPIMWFDSHHRSKTRACLRKSTKGQIFRRKRFKWQRARWALSPHNIGRSITMAAITMALSQEGHAAAMRYDEIDKAPERPVE